MEFLGKAEFWQAFFIVIQTAVGFVLPVVGGWILWLRGNKNRKVLQAQIQANKENIKLNETANTSLQEGYSRVLTDYGFIKDLLLATRQLADNLQLESVSDKKKIVELGSKISDLEKQRLKDMQEIEALRASNAKKDARIEALEQRVKELEAIRPGTGPLSVKVDMDASSQEFIK